MNLKIDWIDGNCPVQGEGYINGLPFYFRARGSHWSLTVYIDNKTEWKYEEQYGDQPYSAGWMENSEANAFIEKAAGMYVGEVN